MMRKIYQDIILCYKFDTISRDYPCVPMNENGSPPKLDQNLILAYGDRQVRIFHPRILVENWIRSEAHYMKANKYHAFPTNFLLNPF